MSRKLQKSIGEYISKIKKQAPHLQFRHSSLSYATSKILSGYRCKHTKTLSFSDVHNGRKNHHDQRQHPEEEGETAAATMEDIENFCNENFKTWYNDEDYDSLHHKDIEHTHDEEQTAKDDASTLRGCFGVLDDSPRFFFTPPRDLGRSRFFVSSSSSGSLVEGAGSTGVGTTSDSEDRGSTSAQPKHAMMEGMSAAPGEMEDCIALLTVSPSPYEDFRRSMQEMVAARSNHHQRVDWDFMEELLFCYLRLNEKKQYRYILSAFADLLVDLRQDSSNSEPEGSRS